MTIHWVRLTHFSFMKKLFVNIVLVFMVSVCLMHLLIEKGMTGSYTWLLNVPQLSAPTCSGWHKPSGRSLWKARLPARERKEMGRWHIALCDVAFRNLSWELLWEPSATLTDDPDKPPPLVQAVPFRFTGDMWTGSAGAISALAQFCVSGDDWSL